MFPCFLVISVAVLLCRTAMRLGSIVMMPSRF
jgi:hypothetical protein